MKKMFLAAMAALALMFNACGDAASTDSVSVVRLDRDMYRYKMLDSAARDSMRRAHVPELSAMMRVLEYDTLNDANVTDWSLTLPVEIFSPMTDQAFQSLDTLERAIGSIYANAAKKGVELPRYRFAAVAWGRDKSIVFVDTVALIALNHYLGPDSPAYRDWPLYKRAMKSADMMPYDIAEAMVATAYPYQPGPDGATVLSRMLYEGAVTEAKMQLVDDAQQRRAMGFTQQQMADITTNEALIWQKMVTEKMLYSTDADLADRLFGRLPYSTPISPAAPGRTAVFTGHALVKSYLRRNKVELDSLLKPGFYNNRAVLQQLDYQPGAK